MTKHTEQPEALMLAEALETPNHPFTQSQAAAELRRLHEEVKCEERRFNDLWDQFAALHKVNQVLLEALKLAQTIIGFGKEWDQIDAAIAKATGEQA